MSQFLTHLIASSRGTAEVIQPRMPSMFEPYRREGGGTGAPPGLVSHRDPRASDDEGERRARTHPEPPANPPGSPMWNIPAARTATPNPPPVQGEITPNLPSNSQRNSGVPAGPSLSDAPSKRGVGDDAGSYQPSATSVRAVLPPAVIPQFVIRPPVLPRIAPAKAPATVAPTAPPIEVTIGRVEVRAIFPEAPARRSPPARTRPSVSLDDYLKRGSERGQR